MAQRPFSCFTLMAARSNILSANGFVMANFEKGCFIQAFPVNFHTAWCPVCSS